MSIGKRSGTSKIPETLKQKIVRTLKILLPLVLATAILGWMYHGLQWEDIQTAMNSGIVWRWMWLSLPFGVTAQIFRALRWRQLLQPAGEEAGMHTSICSIFLSYASSLVVPRMGEILRCDVLRRYDGVNFTRSVGTVVTERIIDTLFMLLLSSITVLCYIPAFRKLLSTTGFSIEGFLGQFSTTGYMVVGICLICACLFGILLIKRLSLFSKTKNVVTDLKTGLLSAGKVKHPMLFLLYTIGIWGSYYLHFYLTFFSFTHIGALPPSTALVAFVVGSFAVLIPTPNGAGPWHFTVKTILVLYGIGDEESAFFVLLVHTIQTLLVAVLGLYAIVVLALTKERKDRRPKHGPTCYTY